MAQIIQFKIDFNRNLQNYLENEYPYMKDYRILSRSLDSRNANRGKRPKYNFKIEIIEEGEKFNQSNDELDKLSMTSRPIIIGMGPAGLFCALRFAEYGIKTILVERGDDVQNRVKHIAHYWKTGKLNENSNVCFGAGGAGLFSDGKLTTRIKSPLVSWPLKKFVEFGANEEIKWVTNPHLGSNKIRNIINEMTLYLQRMGHELHYNEKMVDILSDNDGIIGIELENRKKLFSRNIVLATGHSARDVYSLMKNKNILMEHKDFAIGVRIEHQREFIDKLQYGQFADDSILGSANYQLSYHNKLSDRGTYSFCMCPGGYVLSAGNEVDGIVTNGMSNSLRNSRCSNSALVVSVKAFKDFATDDILAGIEFQRKIERDAFLSVRKRNRGSELPGQMLKDFMKEKVNKISVKPSSPSGVYPTNLKNILPKFIFEHLQEGIIKFEKKMKGFMSKDSIIYAPETRTSAPLRIVRDKENLQSVSLKGLYPCGEGAGMAGGIISAAVDGIKVCEAILKNNGKL